MKKVKTAAEDDTLETVDLANNARKAIKEIDKAIAAGDKAIALAKRCIDELHRLKHRRYN